MNKRVYYYDLHCHTNISQCSPEKIEEIIDVAKKRGLDGVGITDHNKLYKGPLNINGIDIIPGTEIDVEGDIHILAFFIKKDIERGLNIKEAVREIQRQGGYAVWAHPLRDRFLEEKEEIVFSLVDAIEVGNAMDSDKERERLLNICSEFYLVYSAGSDAHISGQVGTGVVKTPLKIDKENFISALDKGEICLRDEIKAYRRNNRRWRKIIRIFTKNGVAKRSKKVRSFFKKVFLRSYLRINNIRLKKVLFSFKDEVNNKERDV